MSFAVILPVATMLSTLRLSIVTLPNMKVTSGAVLIILVKVLTERINPSLPGVVSKILNIGPEPLMLTALKLCELSIFYWRKF